MTPAPSKWLFVSIVGTATAQAEEAWRLRLTGVSATSLSGGSFGNDFGYGLGVEYRPTERFGVELIAVDVDVESEVEFEFGPISSSITSSVGIQPILFGVNFHLTSSERFDFYLGPLVGHAKVEDLRTTISGDFGEAEVDQIPLDDAFVFGGRLGFDLAFGSGSSFLTGGASYLRVPLDVTGEEEAEAGDLDAVVFQLGVGFRF